ncbi:MAG: ATP-binding protein [Betaproteobacteria bacterium]|nr:ATP-binding protein [Betaproteobacteria bacterium]
MAESAYPRNVRRALKLALSDTPVVALLGPRQSGKSTLVRTLTPERAYVTLDEEPMLRTAREDPVGFIAALPGRVTLDEIQRAPGLLLAIKAAVDSDRRPGRFLLTGSADLLLLPKTGDSLAGRIEFVHLHPLTESEKERQPGALLHAFLTGRVTPRIRGIEAAPHGQLQARLLRGGYPPAQLRSPDRARQWHRQYLRTLLERDVADIARVRDAAELGRLVEIVALRSASLLNLSILGAQLGMRRETADQYLNILERLFLLRRLPAWHRNEARRLIKAPKIHLIDSGLAATLAGLEAGDWTARRERYGHLTESFVVQQIIAQAGWTDPDLRFWHYRDKDQVEVDLVITRGRRTWGVEVKTAATVTPADGNGLRRLAEQCGKDFQGGMILYAGTSTLPTADRRILAVPLSELWTQ